MKINLWAAGLMLALTLLTSTLAAADDVELTSDYEQADPAPQAAAWDRALRVIFMETTHHAGEVNKGRPWRAHKQRGRAAVKSARRHEAHGH